MVMQVHYHAQAKGSFPESTRIPHQKSTLALSEDVRGPPTVR